MLGGEEPLSKTDAERYTASDMYGERDSETLVIGGDESSCALRRNRRSGRKGGSGNGGMGEWKNRGREGGTGTSPLESADGTHIHDLKHDNDADDDGCTPNLDEGA